MFDETSMNPAAIAAMTESAPRRRRAANDMAKPSSRPPRAPIANGTATPGSQPITASPLVSNPLAGRPHEDANQTPFAAGHSIPHAAISTPAPTIAEPHEEYLPYDPTPVADVINAIITTHRLRQGMIKAQTKLVLQAMASIRFAVHQDGDYDSDDAKKAARKRADDLYRKVAADPAHPLHGNIMPYLLALEPLEAQRTAYEKEMVKLAKRLPVYPFVKSISGFGDVSFATIVGECGDIGTYKSIAAVWKRLGLAVFDGKRQGAPGDGATKDDWIRHGYNKQRRSVSWNARNQIIGGMGLWRPAFGSDLAEASYYQRVFAERARYESEKLDLPVTESAKGKESYKKHATNRAMRYTEKRLLRELYKAWRRLAMAARPCNMRALGRTAKSGF